jgi:hypothetical protein
MLISIVAIHNPSPHLWTSMPVGRHLYVPLLFLFYIVLFLRLRFPTYLLACISLSMFVRSGRTSKFVWPSPFESVLLFSLPTGLRALLRFLTGISACITRGVIVKKTPREEAASKSLVTLRVDHIFVRIKEAGEKRKEKGSGYTCGPSGCGYPSRMKCRG